MEPKVIIYIVLGIAYFLYTMHKKSQENKELTSQQDKEEEYDTPPPSRPVSPPVGNSIEDILREIKRQQQEAEVKKRQQVSSPKPIVAREPKKQPKEFLLKEKKKGLFEEGNYERDLTDEEKIERGNLKLENEGVYKIKTIEEEQIEEATFGYQFNARNAIIGSIIFERRF